MTHVANFVQRKAFEVIAYNRVAATFRKVLDQVDAKNEAARRQKTVTQYFQSKQRVVTS